uniref:Uncharacterized protein n=1 Tax=Peromyscus maniculatus bairdii TaxID=230844 RepID=A0A8C8W7Y5_PERMB
CTTFLLWSPKALITLPKASCGRKPQLMEMPSLARSPVAPVLLSRSEPAKSTKWNLAVSVSYSVPVGAAPSGSPVTVSFTCPPLTLPAMALFTPLARKGSQAESPKETTSVMHTSITQTSGC